MSKNYFQYAAQPANFINMTCKDCQLKNSYEFKKKSTCINNLYQAFLASLKKFITFFKNLFKSISLLKPRTVPGVFDISTEMIVKVKERKDIQRTLGFSGKYKGCGFATEMRNYCGKEYKVIKEVNYFYDEAKQKLCKCKNIVLLEGVFCSGKKRFRESKCDRSCFYLWSTAWLEKPEKY